MVDGKLPAKKRADGEIPSVRFILFGNVNGSVLQSSHRIYTAHCPDFDGAEPCLRHIARDPYCIIHVFCVNQVETDKGGRCGSYRYLTIL